MQNQGEGSWTPTRHDFVGDPVTQLLTDARDGARYAALNLGHFGPKLHRLAPGADAWEEISCPAFPEGEEASAQELWALESGGADQPGRLWAGMIPGGLFRSDDHGQSFEVQSEGLPQSHAYDRVFRHALAIDASGDRLAFGSTTGGLWLTQNGGDRWEQQSLRLPPVYVVKWSA